MRATQENHPLFVAAKEAVIFMMPLLNMEAFRRRCMAQTPSNSFSHGRQLFDHTNRVVTTPNNDTLYSMCWLDLRDGPVSLTMPPSEGRYMTLALLDMYTNNYVVLGDRTSGPDGGEFTVVGPEQSSAGLPEPVVRSPTPLCFAFVRVLVNDADDLQAACAVQDRFQVAGPVVETPVPSPEGDIDRHADWSRFFAQASVLYQFHRPRATDWAAVRRMAPLRLNAFDAETFTPDEVSAIEAGMAAGRAELDGAMISKAGTRQGWQAPPDSHGDFKQDYLRRAGVSIFGLLALPWQESTCFSATMFGGQRLDGRVPMKWHLPSLDTIAVDAFWSLTMYETTEDGERWFTKNPLNRFAIGDRTPGMEINPDGSLDIWIGHNSPGPEREANWLPAPEGPYSLLLRCYHPRPEFHATKYSQLPEPEVVTE